MIRNLTADFSMISILTFSVAILIFTLGVITSLCVQNSFAYILSGKSEFDIGPQLNISNNTEGDSVYAQVAASGSNVYVVWQDTEGSDTPPPSNRSSSSTFDSLYSQNKNYEIYFRKSTDGGITFENDINLSNSSGFSEHPQIAAIGNNVYIVWVDDTYGNKQISFTKSVDAGSTFDKSIKISNNTLGNSQDVEIAAFGDALYVVWEYTSNNENLVLGDTNDSNSDTQKNRILFRASEDAGNTFANIKTISDIGDKLESRPKVAASGENLYITWNIGTPEDRTIASNDDENNIGVYTVKSTDGGKIFSKPYKLNQNSQPVGETQVASSGSNIYVVWAGDPDKRIESNMFFSKSSDGGKIFEQAVIIQPPNKTNSVATGKSGTSLNAEIAALGNNIFIPWQNKANEADRNEEILLIKSNDKGGTFNTSLIANVSSNDGISECPSIAVSSNNIYIVWEDDTTGDHEIFFKRLALI